jgi:hypothetical protein
MLELFSAKLRHFLSEIWDPEVWYVSVVYVMNHFNVLNRHIHTLLHIRTQTQTQ